MNWQGEKRKGTPENIIDFWAGKAEGFSEAHGGMMRDHYYRLTEIDALSKRIRGGRVLDAGCGAGWATMFYAVNADHVVGCDITGGLIARANRMLADPVFRYRKYWSGLTPFGAPLYRHNVAFEVQDVLDLPYADGAFDTVMFQRLLINLPTWDLQRQALAELVRVLDGQMLISEVTEDGHAYVNALRKEFDLEPLTRYWHNRYLRHDEFVEELEGYGLHVMSERQGLYGFLSKVFYPAMISPEEPQFLSGFNQAAHAVSVGAPGIGADLYRFLDETFRGALAYQQPYEAWAKQYDAVLSQVAKKDINMEGIALCNHQTLYRATREAK
ncbi:MAG TPA: class I SAM-dependent methyltransferase [Anaerolineae bacterium]|nr:class I SAM-dependent methyltransferase [Anaerolineae bacterium]